MKRKSFILLFVLVALIAVMAFSGCSSNNGGSTPSPSPTQEAVSQTDAPPSTENAQDIGQGDTVFRFEMTDDNGEVNVWNVSTDEKTVGAALLAVDLIKGEISTYGLYVEEVNGLKADYDTDKAYWAFYVDGEYATAGADSTEIEPERTYAFIYTKA